MSGHRCNKLSIPLVQNIRQASGDPAPQSLRANTATDVATSALLSVFKICVPTSLGCLNLRVNPQKIWIHDEGFGLVRRLRMMRIIARRTKAATALA
jgi:hypothetical protein